MEKESPASEDGDTVPTPPCHGIIQLSAQQSVTTDGVAIMAEGSDHKQCDLCGLKCQNAWDLAAHLRAHAGVRPFQCEHPGCEASFSQKGNLTAHQRTHAKDAKRFSCEECDKTFSRKTSLRRHVRVHIGFKPFQCSECDMRFFRKESLDVHIRGHTGSLPYVCDVLGCGKRFRQKSAKNTHVRQHMKISELSPRKKTNVSLRLCILSALKFGLAAAVTHGVLLEGSFGPISRSLIIGAILFLCSVEPDEKEQEEKEEKEEREEDEHNELLTLVKSAENGRFKPLLRYFEGLEMVDIPYLNNHDILENTDGKDERLMKIFLRKHLDMAK